MDDIDGIPFARDDVDGVPLGDDDIDGVPLTKDTGDDGMIHYFLKFTLNDVPIDHTTLKDLAAVIILDA